MARSVACELIKILPPLSCQRGSTESESGPARLVYRTSVVELGVEAGQLSFGITISNETAGKPRLCVGKVEVAGAGMELPVRGKRGGRPLAAYPDQHVISA